MDWKWWIKTQENCCGKYQGGDHVSLVLTYLDTEYSMPCYGIWLVGLRDTHLNSHD